MRYLFVIMVLCAAACGKRAADSTVDVMAEVLLPSDGTATAGDVTPVDGAAEVTLAADTEAP